MSNSIKHCPERIQWSLVLQGGQEGHHSELMDSYVKEQKRDDAERDPEM